MRRLMLSVTKMLPWAAVAILTGCSVTDLQLKDFASSTLVRVAAQTVTSIVESGVMGTQGTM